MTKGIYTEAPNRKQANIPKAKTASAYGMNLRSGKCKKRSSVGAENIKMEE